MLLDFPGASEMLRILVINWRDIENPEAGGAEVHLHEIFRRIVGMGHKVTLLSSKFPGSLPHKIVDGIEIIRTGNRLFFNFFVPTKTRAMISAENYDIVIDDINKIPFYTPLYVRRPILAIVHHLFASSIFLEASLPVGAYVYASERLIPLVYRKTRFVVVSESTRSELVKMGLPASNLTVIHNAVDHTRYLPSPSAKSPIPLIAYVGRIKKYKRIEHLLEACREVFDTIQDARLVIAGSGDHLDALKRFSRRIGIAERVEFKGWVTEEEKVKILQQAHVFVTPSSKEGWGVTVIEANACGTPVIATNVPGLRDAVRDGETGFLVPHGDIRSLARRIIEVLKNPDLRNQMSMKSVEWARKFNWDDSARAFLQVITEVVAGQSGK